MSQQPPNTLKAAQDEWKQLEELHSIISEFGQVHNLSMLDPNTDLPPSPEHNDDSEDDEGDQDDEERGQQNGKEGGQGTDPDTHMLFEDDEGLQHAILSDARLNAGPSDQEQDSTERGQEDHERSQQDDKAGGQGSKYDDGFDEEDVHRQLLEAMYQEEQRRAGPSHREPSTPTRPKRSRRESTVPGEIRIQGPLPSPNHDHSPVPLCTYFTRRRSEIPKQDDGTRSIEDENDRRRWGQTRVPRYMKETTDSLSDDILNAEKSGSVDPYTLASTTTMDGQQLRVSVGNVPVGLQDGPEE
ncbi:uncharacterized protein B0T15DRAFT_488334 [Chaetomium strumarium]|uniref:Uncharacterized protein n=1 Tax=Chaetomium strumarium TaxID=1170767 RepID=A0AAJ0M598_9PEZI|nr:hypothetical protein B0T15DRAFT_488334 [Chaetomium strumarium]